MIKFKKGDRVKVISAKHCSHGCGHNGCKFLEEIGAIRTITESGVYVHPFEIMGGGCSGFQEDDLVHYPGDWDD